MNEMTPKVYFDSFTKPNYEDFLSNQDSLRHAFNAAVSTSHVAEHIYEYCKKRELHRIHEYPKIWDFFNSLFMGGLIQDFRDVRSVSNVYKHLYGDQHCELLSTGAVESISRVSAEEEISSIFTAGIEQDGIKVKRRDGREIWLLTSMRNVFKHLECEMGVLFEQG